MVFSILCCLAAAFSVSFAHPGLLTYGVAEYQPVQLSSQYHSQDTLGQYSYGYNTPESSKTEQRSLDGVTRGAYSYVDAEGKLQSVHYTAEPVHGFQVVGSNIPANHAASPEPVKDTPEVAQAKADHLKAVEEAKLRNSLASVQTSSTQYVAPVRTLAYNAPYVVPHHRFAYSTFSATPYTYPPLTYTYSGNYLHDTPEVAQAKAEHFAAHAEAQARHFAAKFSH